MERNCNRVLTQLSRYSTCNYWCNPTEVTEKQENAHQTGDTSSDTKKQTTRPNKKDSETKSNNKMNKYTDQKIRAKQPTFKVSDSVHVCRPEHIPKGSSMSTEPLTVVRRFGQNRLPTK